MNNIVFAVVGASGSGKTCFTKYLEKHYGYHRIVTNTTRDPRDREVQDVDYHFLSIDDFNKKDIIAPTKYDGNYYGISEADFEDSLENKKSIVVVDEFGANTLLQLYPENVIKVYISISKDKALEHMENRGMQGRTRFLYDVEESQFREYYLKEDFVFINDFPSALAAKKAFAKFIEQIWDGDSNANADRTAG